MAESMVDIDAALDDIITKQRRGGGGKRPAPRIDEPLTPVERRGGGGGIRGRRRGFSDNFWSGGGFGGRRQIGRLGGRRSLVTTSNNTDVVWINISNLPETVLTADLQELFEAFTLFGVGVHYDEFGQHMGTADLFVDSRSSQAILREYTNIAIDGQKIRFAIVSEQASDTPQFKIQQRRAGIGRPSLRGGGGGKRSTFGPRMRSDSGRSSRTYSRSRSPVKRNVGAKPRGGVGGVARKPSTITRQVKSAAELDRELEAYMNGMKHPRVKLE